MDRLTIERESSHIQASHLLGGTYFRHGINLPCGRTVKLHEDVAKLGGQFAPLRGNARDIAKTIRKMVVADDEK